MALNKKCGELFTHRIKNKNIKVYDVYEYDIKKAFPTYLKKYKHYNLSDSKEKYLYEVGLLIKENPKLRNEIIDYIKSTFCKLFEPYIDNIKIYRFYVDEIITNINVTNNNEDIDFKFDIFTIKKRKLKVFLNTKLINGFIKIYKNGKVKIDKKTILPYAVDLINDIINFKIPSYKIVDNYLSGKYPPVNYIVRDKDLIDVIILDNLAYNIDIEKLNENLSIYGQNIISNINKKYYYNIIFTYINLLK